MLGSGERNHLVFVGRSGNRQAWADRIVCCIGRRRDIQRLRESEFRCVECAAPRNRNDCRLGCVARIKAGLELIQIGNTIVVTVFGGITRVVRIQTVFDFPVVGHAVLVGIHHGGEKRTERLPGPAGIQRGDFGWREDPIPDGEVIDFAIPITVARIWILANHHILAVGSQGRCVGLDRGQDAIDIEAEAKVHGVGIGDGHEVVPIATRHVGAVLGTLAGPARVYHEGVAASAVHTPVAAFTLGNHGLPGFVEAIDREPPGDGDAAARKGEVIGISRPGDLHHLIRSSTI